MAARVLGVHRNTSSCVWRGHIRSSLLSFPSFYTERQALSLAYYGLRHNRMPKYSLRLAGTKCAITSLRSAGERQGLGTALLALSCANRNAVVMRPLFPARVNRYSSESGLRPPSRSKVRQLDCEFVGVTSVLSFVHTCK